MSDKLLTDAELAAIAERAEKATPGPWHYNCWWGEGLHNVGFVNGDALAIRSEDLPFIERREDTEFVASARSDIPRLLADLHRYRAWCRRLVEIADDQGVYIGMAKDLAREVRAALEGK